MKKQEWRAKKILKKKAIRKSLYKKGIENNRNKFQGKLGKKVFFFFLSSGGNHIDV